MTVHGIRSITLAACLTTMLGFVSAPAHADRSMVILTQDCEYVLLDSRSGQILVKMITGVTPRTGDVLTGEFEPKNFSELQNERDGAQLSVWVDMVDRHGNRALSRYTKYCS
jgi:hypothetical protein